LSVTERPDGARVKAIEVVIPPIAEFADLVRALGQRKTADEIQPDILVAPHVAFFTGRAILLS